MCIRATEVQEYTVHDIDLEEKRIAPNVAILAQEDAMQTTTRTMLNSSKAELVMEQVEIVHVPKLKTQEEVVHVPKVTPQTVRTAPVPEAAALTNVQEKKG